MTEPRAGTTLDSMIKHTRRSLAGIASLVAATATVVLLATQAQGSASRTLHLTISGTKIATVDVPPLITSKTSPETPGDEVIAVSKVTGPTRGRRYLVCSATETAASVERALYSCQITYVLRGGTITAAAVAHITGNATAAITGGTGIYAAARGTLATRQGADTLTLN